MAELTHINEQGRAKMVDVSAKADTQRIGVASGKICMQRGDLSDDHRSEDKKGGMCWLWLRSQELWRQEKDLGDDTHVPSAFNHRRGYSV